MGNLELRAFEIEFNRHITKQERKMAKIVGKGYLGKFKRPGWIEETKFYLFNCETHGLVVDHNTELQCPLCQTTKHKEPNSAIGPEEFNSLRNELRGMEKQ